MQEHISIEQGWSWERKAERKAEKQMSELQGSWTSCSAFALHDQSYNNASGNQEVVWLFLKEIAQDILEIYNLP